MKKFRILAVLLSCIFILSACTTGTDKNSTDREGSVEERQEVLADGEGSVEERQEVLADGEGSVEDQQEVLPDLVDGESDENPKELQQEPQNYTKIATLDYDFIYNLS